MYLSRFDFFIQTLVLAVFLLMGGEECSEAFSLLCQHCLKFDFLNMYKEKKKKTTIRVPYNSYNWDS